jgi:hypothetical protein
VGEAQEAQDQPAAQDAIQAQAQALSSTQRQGVHQLAWHAAPAGGGRAS